MKKYFLILVTIMCVFALSSCDSILGEFPPFNETPVPPQNTSTNTLEPPPQESTATFTPLPPVSSLTFTPLPDFTDTPSAPTEDVLGTLAALQETLDAAADHIGTLEAEKTQSPPPPTSGPSSPTSTKSSAPSLPDNVWKVTIIHKANLRISKRKNDAGKPVMSMARPRIVLDEGSIQYVFNKRVDADGNVVFYEIWDPDGVVTQVLYLRAVDVQIRTSEYNTSYGPIPDGVVIAKANPSAVLRYIKEYNVGGRPLMKIKEPRVVLVDNAKTWVYPDLVIGDGGSLFYEIYDPDGNVTTVLYAREVDILLPNALQQ